MLANNLRFGEVRAAEQRLWEAFRSRADEAITRINTDPAFLDRLIEYALDGAYTPTESQSNAEVIMGKNMITIRELICALNLRPTREELTALAKVPFTEERLVYCRKTHVLVPVPGRSLVDLYLMESDTSLEFAHTAEPTRWMLLQKDIVKDSNNKPFDLQQRMLLSGQIPTARDAAFGAKAYFKTRNERLFGPHDSFYGQFVRTATETAPGMHVLVTCSPSEKGPDIAVVPVEGLSADDVKASNIGLASCHY